MRWRHQVPVRSPLSAGALVAGARAAAGNGRSEAAVRDLTTLLRERYAPIELLLTDSGTTALRVAMLAALKERSGGKWRRGAPVALPAYSCYDLATAAEGAGVRVVFYDLDPRSLAPDLESLQAARRLGCAAIVVVHPYGYPLDLGPVNRLAAEVGAVVIEDAAQAAGATLHDRPAGAHASLAVLSFGRGKGLTGGSGGALLAHDAVGTRAVAHAQGLLGAPQRGWRDLAVVTAQMFLERPNLYAVPAALPFLHLGETVHRAPHPPRAPSPASCALVAATWRLAEREVATRRRNAQRLLAAVGRDRTQAFETLRVLSDAQPGYLRLPVVASPQARRAVSASEARHLGVMPGYPKALCDLEGFAARCGNRDADFPGARMLAARLCTLPTHGRLGERDLVRLEQWITTAGEA